MENNEILSRTNRRILIALYAITVIVSWILILQIKKEETNDTLFYTILGILVLNGIIDKYIKSKTEAFKIANNKMQLDERLTFIRIKAQRDAYLSTLIIFIIILPLGYQFFKDRPFDYIIIVLCIVVSLILYLPAMIIAWQEKEV